jgi:hypothetical protein
MRRARSVAIVIPLLAACATASTVGRGYEIHTSDLSCDEANRYTQQALGDMGLEVTGFRKAQPRSPGYAKASRGAGDGAAVRGRVEIGCDADGVHLVPNQSGFLGSQQFERGFFLSLTGRADLVVEREGRDSTGRLHKREAGEATADSPTRTADATSAARAATAQAGGATRADSPFSENTAGGVEVQVELVRGFATVLDFEANVSAVGILPVKITVENKTTRTYDFSPKDVVLRKDGTADRVESMSAAKAVERLKSAKGNGEDSQQPPTPDTVAGAPVKGLGDVEAGSRALADREIKKARLDPGQSVTGYLYFPDAEYDRARVLMTDTATGEAEGFVVEF